MSHVSTSPPPRRRLCPAPTFLVRFGAAGILLTGLAVPVGAQEARPFTTEIALDVVAPQIVAATPDASHVAVVARTRRGRVDVDHQRFGDPTYVAPSLVRAMVVDTRSGASVWLHEEPAQVGSFAFSPDGARLAYLHHDGSEFGLRVHDVDAETTRDLPLASDKSIASSSSVTWTPDGGSVLVALRPQGWKGRASDAFYAMTDAPVIVQDSRNDFLAWDRVRNMAEEEVTALVDIEDGSVRELLADVAPRDVGFSPDGTRLTYGVANRTKTSYTRRDGTEYALYSLELRGGATPTELVAPSEERLTAIWNEARDAYAYAHEGAVMVRRLDSDEGEDVTEGLRTLSGDTTEIDFSVEAWSESGQDLLLTSANAWHVLNVEAGDLQTVFTLEPDEEQRPERDLEHWTDDGRYLYFGYSAPDRWDRGLMRLDIGSGVLDTLMLDDHVYGGWAFSDDGETVVYTMSDGDRPDDVWVRTTGYPTPTRLTDLNPQLEGVALAETELVEYLDVDGNTLYGILYYPPDYEPGRRYPLVAEIYEEFFDNGFNENMNLITAQGWLGFRPSVRFEEGYPGEAWLKAVPNAINELIQRGLVDEDRVGVYGQSYGGYAVNLLITQTDRFAAAANVSGKVNMISFLGDSPKITTRNYAAAEVGQDRIGATLWEQPQKYIDHSAVMFADRIETPLLMLSGEGDWNVPATNQREMYYALRRLGKEVVWAHYTAGGHGAGRASSIGDFHDHWQRMFDWFAEHFDEAANATVSDQGGR
jgi:dipeptidyl aminopeptidase/acylaminoacyl peptidase